MKKIYLLLLLTLIDLCCFAQDEVIDLTQGIKQQGNLTLTYSESNRGAAIFYNQYEFYSLRIQSSGKKIAHLELEGQLASSKYVSDMEAANGNGELRVCEGGITRWDGLTADLRIWGTKKNTLETTGYYFTSLRLWYEGTDFTPTPDGEQQEWKPDLGGSATDGRYYAHAPTRPAGGKAVRMAFVYNSIFRGESLDDYMLWKTKQGYDVVEICADEMGRRSGKCGDDLALEIRDSLMRMNPRPAYILICGDKDEVPPFDHRTAMAGGQTPVTDFFYGEYTGDFFAEAYVGRFSAQTLEQLETQMEKTRYMAMINPEEADWLKHSLVVHSPYSDISTENAAAFARLFPLQFEGNTTTEVRASQAGLVNENINNGCSHVTYIGHGGQQLWWDVQGSYYASNARQLANKNKYPVVLGMTCLTGSFQWIECMAETFMWQKQGGAVAYIGATRESWDGSDNIFLCGGDGGKQTFPHLGFMRSLYHPLPEDESQLSRTIGEAFYIGKFSDRFLGEFKPFRQFMEFFHLFGDPTYQPYITTPKQMFIKPESKSAAAGSILRVETAPDAMVAISKDRRVVAVTLADKAGHATLKVPADAPQGECVLYSSAPLYNDMESTIILTAADGKEDEVAETEKLPRVEYTDVIDLKSAEASLTENNYFPFEQPDAFSTGSEAEYVIWAATNLEPGTNSIQYAHWMDPFNDVRRGLFLRNKYDMCSFITTASAGNVAYVSIDWLHTCGQAEVLGVYGSTSPYTSTAQAWNGEQGTYLGELRKGQNNSLVLEGEWPYILLRAENYPDANNDQNNVFFKSLTIGWNAITDDEEDDVTQVPASNEPATSIYDLSGRKVHSSTFRSRKGIYIMNGRKVVVCPISAHHY